jgi:hypothetical protein
MIAMQCKLRGFFPSWLLLLSLFICVHPWFLSTPCRAQVMRDREVAVNLTEGRVVVCATKDAILLASMDSRAEPGARPPEITILSALRMGVMMGATEWVFPESNDKPIQLDAEFTKLVSAALNNGGQADDGFRATDLESIGVAVLERLRLLASQLHHKVNLGEDEPILRIVLAGYVRDYGPEAWVLDYHIVQDDLGNGIWRTRVLRPGYNQIYPPEQGKPKTLMEVRYPPEDRATGEPELLDLLQQNDSRLAAVRSTDQIEAKSVALVIQGQSQKSDAAGLTTFLKSAIPAVTPAQTKFTMARVDYDGGFHWILQPPRASAPPPPPGEAAKKPEAPADGSDRPTLLHKAGDGPPPQ